MEVTKIKKRLEIFKSADNSHTDIYLYGYIDRFYGICAKDIKNLLAQIDTGIINVHINSPGGDAFESVAIHNLLRQHKAFVNVYIDGLAASGASEIAMAGDKIFMPKNTMMMIHNAWTFAAGNAKELRKVADNLDKLDAAMTESYAARFVGERSELERLLEEETWLTAEDAKALGLCDEVIELKETDADNADSNGKLADTDEILKRYIPDFATNAERTAKIKEAKEQQKAFNANLICDFLENLNFTIGGKNSGQLRSKGQEKN